MMSEIKQIRHHLPGLLFLALFCASCASSGDSSKSEPITFPWNVDSMYQDVRWLIRERMYKPVQKDIDMKILAWRTSPGWENRGKTMITWTALLLVRYRDGRLQDTGYVDVNGWAFMLVTRDTAGEYNNGHWFFLVPRGHHAPPAMYYDRQRHLTTRDLDWLLRYTPYPMFKGYTQDPFKDSVKAWPILEGHIMVSTWEEVFGEPPKYRFDPVVPPKE